MSQNNSNEKAAMLTKIEAINRIEGFDPSVFAVDYTDLGTGEVHKRLPVITQLAWFRMKYPDGKITVQVTAGNDCFVATARIYPSYKDAADSYLSEATASRGYCAEKPSVSPREWAQTAAIGIALRNAGFGLQFSISGEDFSGAAPDELGAPNNIKPEAKTDGASEKPIEETDASEETAQTELTPEEKFKKAMIYPCPITKYSGKTLGDVLTLDPGALKWVATKFTGDTEIIEAAKTICEYAMEQSA